MTGMQNIQTNVGCTTRAQPVFPGILLIHLSAHGKTARLAKASLQYSFRMYALPDTIKSYVKIKVLELMLFLSVLDIRATE